MGIRNVSEYLKKCGIRTEQELDVYSIITSGLIQLGHIKIPQLKIKLNKKRTFVGLQTKECPIHVSKADLTTML